MPGHLDILGRDLPRAKESQETVTNRNHPARPTSVRVQGRAFAALLLIATLTLLSGCFQQQVVRESPVSQSPALRALPSRADQQPAAGLGDEDPRLGMNVLAGVAPPDAGALTVQVLPNGNVTDTTLAAPSPRDVPTTIVTRWVKTTIPTTLWSGSDAQASPFTELPAASFLKVQAIGPEGGQRLPVYYVGDGLLRRPGNGWVDADAVQTVEAPAPGQVPAVDADASKPLPVWVQAHQATSLWSGPDDKATPLTDLPQWTFLKIAGLERGGRLLVNYAGDYSTRQPGIGWVDQSAVGPAGDPGRWVTNHRSTGLWSGVDAAAMRFTELPQWTKLRVVEGAAPDAQRMQVEFFGDGFTRQPGMAWIGRSDIGPITPPVPLPIPSLAKSAVIATSSQVERHTFASGDDFISTVGTAAQGAWKAAGVPASVTVAQAILESDWGRSRLARQGNNLFGIKALGSVTGPAGVVTLATWEHLDGGDVIVQAPFKAYFTLAQSIEDHGSFFTRNRRYADALAVAGDARAFARAIQSAGYATDPGYASKLIGLMDRYDLYRFDS
jgi:hypothetical protein